MRNKSFIVFVFLVIFAASSIFAHGQSDVEEIEVENLNSWQESFDLDGKAPKGAVKYNIMITATDLGGNQRVEGPYNLYIDPESDLPICGITNPSQNMRVVGNLNIVGTCVDDDAVSYVELVFDGDTDHPIRAEGREFWSYYLDTVNLQEGDHTIKVTGYDINGLAGHPIQMTWQLDRNQPITTVEDKTMGMLVSGKVNFKGHITDGNGIKELYYSVDNGQYFTPVKLGKGKDHSNSTFDITVDSKQFPDGPAVIWFKAIDNAGSVGVYSFLYFIDNTIPDVKIVYPTPDDTMNGKFTIAGYAKDTIGITGLSWTFGTETGVFDLVPGNPYWSLDVNTIGAEKEKSRKFTVHAVDKAGNVVDKSISIKLDQEQDKPTVDIRYPQQMQVYNGDDEAVYVAGIANDDDGIKSVQIQLDNMEQVFISTKGVFYQELCKASDLTAGNHKIVVYGIDENDIAGNPTVITITSKGGVPSYSDAAITKGKEAVPFENGMEINPEAGQSFSVKVASAVGISNIKTQVIYGKNQVMENEIPLKNVTSYDLVMPINPDFPKGVAQIVVYSTDSIGRVSESHYYAYIRNTSVIKSDELKIVFEDSTVREDGSILSNPDYPVTGYFLGGNISAIELVPETPFARVEAKGNLIKLIPIISNATIGSSEPVVVSVTTDKGMTVESNPIVFKYDHELPTLKLDNHSTENAVDGKNGYVAITGTVSCKTGVGGVSYRILGAKAELKNGVVGSVTNVPASSYTAVAVEEDGTFKINLDTSSYDEGMWVVEVVAESAGGNRIAKAVAINTMNTTPEFNGKPAVAKAPVIAWIDGFDVYALGVYQGNLDRDFYVFYKNDMVEGTNPVSADVTPNGGKLVSGKFNAFKAPTLDANLVYVDGNPYYSGMQIYLPYGPQKVAEKVATVQIETGTTVTSVNYEFTGDEVAGGDNVQKGAAKLIKPAAGDTRWTAEIPLNNLPNRVNHLKVTVKAGALEKVITGSIAVIRNVDSYLIEDSEGLFTFPGQGTVYDTKDENWVLKDGSKLYIYANLAAPIKAELDTDMSGIQLTSEADSKFFTISAEKDGIYSDVKVIFTDGLGTVWETPLLNFLVDSEAPELFLQTPEFKDWLGDFIHVSGTSADALGVRTIEYSLNQGANWTEIGFSSSDNQNSLGVTFNSDIDIPTMEDGFVQLNVRAIDNAGHIREVKTVCFKDTQAPVATVIVPLEEDIVNGETKIVFKVEDNGAVKDVQYSIHKEGKTEDFVKSIERSHLISVEVGTEEMPIDDTMSFILTDDAGNVGSLGNWKFSIDNASDLPRAEIHVPEEMEVITRDFTISGVIYDDDGDSTIWYKIDDGEYNQISQPNTSFSIDVPIITMSDNEHTITVYAVDINGVRGEETTRTFRVSLEEPKGEIVSPSIDVSVSKLVTISGIASDKNGISKVEISLDNGNSYNLAEGQEEWEYTVDTRAINGGTQVVFYKITDNYGIVGLYSSLINIDNKAPDISLDLPLDDSVTTGHLFFSGYAFDDVELKKMYVTIRNMEETSTAIVKELKLDYIIGETLDISELSNGYYNVQVTGEDLAGNKTNVGRNIYLDKTMPPAQVDILYPLNGEHKNGTFNIYGQAATNMDSPIRSLRLFVDDIFVKETELSYSGFFKFEISSASEVETGEYDEEGNPIKVVQADMKTGAHVYRVDAMLENGQQVSSREQTISYDPYGPWIKLDNFSYGDFAINRPYVKGSAGYAVNPEEALIAKAKGTKQEVKAAFERKAVESVEISFDNGKTWEFLSKTGAWKYRVENEDLPEGYKFMLLRAKMKNGEVAVERFIVQIDNTAPTIRLINPNAGGRYNQKMIVSGLSSDDVKLDSVVVALRKGDKAAYEIPSFVQGLYLDFRFWGATLFDIGAGFTFFDDNVKLQFGWGMFTQNQRDMVSGWTHRDQTELRYGGSNILHLKILANVAQVPFSYFFGRDFSWLSSSFAIGAEFARFNATNSGQPQVLSALLGQVEFPKIHLDGVQYFSTFSMYTEGSLWFIPTDVTISDNAAEKINKLVPQISIGIRANVF